jgi:hypothetical protein
MKLITVSHAKIDRSILIPTTSISTTAEAVVVRDKKKAYPGSNGQSSHQPSRTATASGLPRKYSGQEYQVHQQTKPSSSVTRSQPLTAATAKAVVRHAQQTPSAVPRELLSTSAIVYCQYQPPTR